MTNQNWRDVLKDEFGGNVSEAARVTGISRQTWWKWGKKDAPGIPPLLAAWIINSPAKASPVSPPSGAEDSSPAS